MLDAEPAILSELAGVTASESFEGLDWDDVLARAGAAARRPPWLRTALVAAAVLAVAAPALAFRGRVIDFFAAPHAPRPAVVEFGRMQVAAFPSAAPGVLPHQARLISRGRSNAGPGSLSVAPTRSGGFCDYWASGAPECLPRRSQARRPGVLGTFSYGASPGVGVDWIEGSVLDRSAAVTLRYASGRTTSIPFVWVTAPIRAGFFDYRIPPGHDTPRTRPVALAVEVRGRPQARVPISAASLDDGTVDRTDRWGHSVQVPREAAWSQRKLLDTFLEKDETLVELWVMPSRRGTSRRCFVASPFTEGCVPTVLQGDPLQLTVLPGSTVLLFGETAANVARIRLHFENGAVQAAKPTDGFLLTRLRPANYPPHRRLVRADALGPTGRTLFVERFDPRRRDVYPCARPRDYGYGVRMCP